MRRRAHHGEERLELDDHGCDEVGKLLTGTVDSRVPVSRCNAVISWQNRRATLAGNCRKGRGEIRWTGTPSPWLDMPTRP